MIRPSACSIAAAVRATLTWLDLARSSASGSMSRSWTWRVSIASPASPCSTWSTTLEVFELPDGLPDIAQISFIDIAVARLGGDGAADRLGRHPDARMRRPRQTEMLAQHAAGIFATKQSALLQDRHHLVHEIVER